MAASHHLGFDGTGNSAIRSADPKTLPRTKYEMDRMTHCGDIAI